jgi:hypothetical protein
MHRRPMRFREAVMSWQQAGQHGPNAGSKEALYADKISTQTGSQRPSTAAFGKRRRSFCRTSAAPPGLCTLPA